MCPSAEGGVDISMMAAVVTTAGATERAISIWVDEDERSDFAWVGASSVQQKPRAKGRSEGMAVFPTAATRQDSKGCVGGKGRCAMWASLCQQPTASKKDPIQLPCAE